MNGKENTMSLLKTAQNIKNKSIGNPNPIGSQQKEEPGFFRKALPYLGGLAAAAGIYGLLRRGKTKGLSEIERLVNVVKEYMSLEKIKPLLSKYMNDAVKDVDKVIKTISDESGEPFEVVRDLFTKYRIRKLLSLKIDKDDILNQIKVLEGQKKNLREFVLNQYGGTICIE